LVRDGHDNIPSLLLLGKYPGELLSFFFFAYSAQLTRWIIAHIYAQSLLILAKEKQAKYFLFKKWSKVKQPVNIKQDTHPP